MTETDERERIRQRKLQELKQSIQPSQPGDQRDGSSDSTPSEPIQVSGQNQFDELVAEHRVVVADFYADWCGPCQMIAPIMRELALESPATIIKIDIDTNQSIAAKYDVRGVPTVFVFADGAPADRIVGVRGKQVYRQLIDQYAT